MAIVPTDVPYKTTGGIMHQQPVFFDVYRWMVIAAYGSAKTSPIEQGLTYPGIAIFSSKMGNWFTCGNIDGNFHSIQNVGVIFRMQPQLEDRRSLLCLTKFMAQLFRLYHSKSMVMSDNNRNQQDQNRGQSGQQSGQSSQGGRQGQSQGGNMGNQQGTSQQGGTGQQGRNQDQNQDQGSRSGNQGGSQSGNR